MLILSQNKCQIINLDQVETISLVEEEVRKPNGLCSIVRLKVDDYIAIGIYPYERAKSILMEIICAASDPEQRYYEMPCK